MLRLLISITITLIAAVLKPFFCPNTFAMRFITKQLITAAVAAMCAAGPNTLSGKDLVNGRVYGFEWDKNAGLLREPLGRA